MPDVPYEGIPDGSASTRAHLCTSHGYPNRVMLEDEISDWEVLTDHVWEHEPSPSPSANHTHESDSLSNELDDQGERA